MMMKTTCTKRPVVLVLLVISLFISTAVATALEIGERAPDFTLPSTMGNDIHLSQFKGKKYVLIQFYSMDFNPTWEANLKARMVDHDEFERLNVQLLAISGDNTFSQQMFASSLQLNYPVLSDYPDLKIIDHYGVLQRIGKADRPVAQGSYFLVDMQGIVRGKWMNPPGEVVPNETFLRARREIAP